MVKYTPQRITPAHLDSVFQSLSHPIRRDIVDRVSDSEHTVGELVSQYDISFPAISKHLKLLEKAKLIIKRKEGRKYIITLAPDALRSVDQYLEQYRQMWQSRHDKLATLLKKETKHERHPG